MAVINHRLQRLTTHLCSQTDYNHFVRMTTHFVSVTIPDGATGGSHLNTMDRQLRITVNVSQVNYTVVPVDSRT